MLPIPINVVVGLETSFIGTKLVLMITWEVKYMATFNSTFSNTQLLKTTISRKQHTNPYTTI